MKHIFEKGADSKAPTLVLFHGTGGTEHDLLPLANIISPESSVLSLRGNVLEHGMPRFFKRLAEGVFDEEDLIFRTKEVYDFLEQAADEYSLDRTNLVAVGYSNGANIAGSLLFHYKAAWKGAILHHPMVPRRGIELPGLSDTPIFIGAGTNDPICSPQETEELNKLLSEAGASVAIHWEHFGHQLTASEAAAAATWFREQFLK
ncbi:alpha/beta hydrolase [Paenibacillus sp. MER TA 81-3]|uniref:alpha/beta hydrolase n=1 Tax=Paenibacillus sp. MER TA 81-3 TaxID=2939573 RepID=UPI00203F17E2|nr:alpha/beta hydrolase [Paenibacillus sp. MER TA 81-3]MCM3339729.1 alpha/beta hydrolase [Paenibacillus sp. MER TA 81-3]